MGDAALWPFCYGVRPKLAANYDRFALFTRVRLFSYRNIRPKPYMTVVRLSNAEDEQPFGDIYGARSGVVLFRLA